ncbi:MAG: WD40 repeat domain-containing protein [Blastocatellia bacterium]|nr:WD40 repeat domain-containing protein [Blastocatellia bacterium]
MSGIATTTPTKMPTLAPLWKAEIDGHVIALQWSPSGRKLAAASIEGPIVIFDADGAAQLTLPGHAIGTTALAWSRDGQHLASGGQDGNIILWDVTARAPKLTLPGGAAWVEHLAWNPLGGQNGIPHLLASAAGRKMRLWDVDGAVVREYEDHASTIASIAWKPATQFLSTASYSRLAIYTPAQEKPHRQFEWKGSILVLAWSPNGKYVATGDQDSTVHFWFDKTGKDLQMWGYPTKVRELSWDATSRYLATGGGVDVTIWDCIKSPEGSKPISLKGHEAFLSALRFQHRGPLLASAGQDGRVIVWQPSKDRKARAGIAINSAVTQLAWSPDDERLATGTESGAVLAFARP